MAHPPDKDILPSTPDLYDEQKHARDMHPEPQILEAPPRMDSSDSEPEPVPLLDDMSDRELGWELRQLERMDARSLDAMSDRELRRISRRLERVEANLLAKLLRLRGSSRSESSELQRLDHDRNEGAMAPAEPGAPWHPWHCLSWAILFGLPVSGSLLAMNFKRLGRPSLRFPTFLATIAFTALLLWWSVSGGSDLSTREGHYTFRGASVLLSLPAWWLQRDAFKAYTEQRKRSANSILPALLVAAMSWAAIFGIAALLD